MPAIPKPTREPKVYRGFKRPELPARVPAVHKPLARPVVYAQPLAAAPVPKREYVRSPKLMRAYGLIPCQFDGCGKTEGIDGCHSNWAVHGKGKSIKADDNRAASGCQDCHRELDQGHAWNEAEKQQRWWRAHVRTVRELTARGFWPAGVPVPEIESNPFDLRETA